jgi:nitroimidazol reductase NimA-like FMN-containing flavoprotein (pyridoxamine 5'-phosphate oxidase superfamily)
MTTKHPKAEALVNHNASDVHTSLDGQVEPWANTVERLKQGGPTWLATVNPDGTPHLVPVGAGWVGETIYFTSGQGTRKRANLAQNSHCALSFSAEGFDIVVEGHARITRDAATVQRVAEAFNPDWPARAQEGALVAPFYAPTSGPGPYDVYEIELTRVFAFGTSEQTNRSTRYTF